MIGAASGEQFVQHNAQGIHIARRRELLAAHLFGTGIGGCHRRESIVRVVRSSQVGLQQLRDAKIQQLRRAVFCDQNVRRLQITMNDEMLMRVLHGGADLPKKLQAFAHVELLLLAILIQRQPFDVFHHEVRSPVFGCAAVEQTRDVRMVQIGQNLPFVLEAALQFFAAGAHQLDGDLLLELIVSAFGQPDRAHSAVRDFVAQLICAEFGIVRGTQRRSEKARADLLCLLIGGEQAFDFAA